MSHQWLCESYLISPSVIVSIKVCRMITEMDGQGWRRVYKGTMIGGKRNGDGKNFRGENFEHFKTSVA